MRYQTHTPLKLVCSNPTFSFRALHHQTQKAQKLLSLLDRCSTFRQLIQVHAHITTSGLQHNQFLIGKLVEVSAIKFQQDNGLSHSMLIFTQAQHPNRFTWNTIIRGFSISQTPHRALLVFIPMCRLSIPLESFTYAFVFKACARSHMLETGRAVHGLAMKSSQASHLFVANTAIHLYSACADLGSAGKVFEEMGFRNIVTWNAMISGYVQNGLPNGGLRVFEWMWAEGIRPDDVTMVGVISACAQNKDLDLGRWIHAYIAENPSEFESNINVGTTLIDMYAQCKQIDIAKKIFNEMQRKDIGVWNALIGGYVFNRCYNEALELFQRLEESSLDPDEATLVCTLRACANVGALDIGKRIHLYAQKKRFKSNKMLDTALVDMYSKCGCLNEAREVFNNMSKRDVMSWTSMIVGLAMHGHSRDALDLFLLMLDSGQKPDGITFLGVLCACSHAGLVDQGVYYFETMRNEYCIAPKIEHYGCMIDLFGRAGQLKEAYAFILSMEIQPNAIVWRALLSACRLHSNVNLAETAINNLFKLQSDHCGDYVLLSNIYASKGKWDLVENIRRKMEEGGIRKIPGLSLIEANSHPRVEKWLELTSYRLGQLGYGWQNVFHLD